MTIKEEEFVHYTECCQSLNNAWNTLKELQGLEKLTGYIPRSAYYYALVEYAKPHNNSFGIAKSGHKLRNPPSQLNSTELELHGQIMQLRNQVLAHSDLTVSGAKLIIFFYGGKPQALIGQNYLPQLPDINAVVSLIERTLDNMYLVRERLLNELPANT
jgi:hypothetical protein